MTGSAGKVARVKNSHLSYTSADVGTGVTTKQGRNKEPGRSQQFP